MKILSFLILFCSALIVTAQHGSVNALDFNGTTDEVSIPNNTALNPTTAFTVEAWINADAWASTSWQGTIVSKDQWTSVSEGWVLRCGANGTLSFNLALNNNGNWYEVVSSSGLMSTGKWYHVAGTYNGSTMKLYLNGKEVGSLTQSGSITASSAPVKIGNIAMASQSRYFNGKIDEVRIWNATLSENTLRQYMCHKLDGNHPNTSNLKAHYTLNNGTGGVVYDQSGNSLNGTISGASWVVSGVPLGDGSGFVYNTSWSGKKFKYGHSMGDTLEIQNISGNPQGVHIYFIDANPNYMGLPPGVASFYSQRYYGIFATSGSNVTFTATYHYDGFPGISNQGKLNYSYRTDYADSTWAGLTVTLDTIQKTIKKTSASSGEYILGSNDDLSPFVLSTPVNTSSFTIQGLSTQTIPFDWFSSHLSMGGGAKYKWVFDYDTADFSSPLITKVSSTGGIDTSANITYLDLANAMKLAGVFYGETMNAKWSVKADAGPLTKLATQPFNISITRDILSSDVINSFKIDQPKDDTLKVYDGLSTLTVFNWYRTKSSAGVDMTYSIEFAGHSGNFTIPVGSFTADNSGADTTASLTDTQLAAMLQSAGIPKKNVYEFKWRTKAEIGSLSKYSTDSNYVFIIWDENPFVSVPNQEVNYSLNLYPNPAKDILTIEWNGNNNEEFDIQLINIEGRVVLKRQKLSGNKQMITLPENIKEGKYLLRLIQGEKIYTESLIISK